MKIDLRDGELYLREHCPLRLTDAPGITVRCTEGVLWMTVTGETGDILLARGETHRIRHSGRIVIESLGGDGRVRLEKTIGKRVAATLTALSGKLRQQFAPRIEISSRRTA
jgi:hypothetical protein